MPGARGGNGAAKPSNYGAGTQQKRGQRYPWGPGSLGMRHHSGTSTYISSTGGGSVSGGHRGSAASLGLVRLATSSLCPATECTDKNLFLQKSWYSIAHINLRWNRNVKHHPWAHLLHSPSRVIVVHDCECVHHPALGLHSDAHPLSSICGKYWMNPEIILFIDHLT